MSSSRFVQQSAVRFRIRKSHFVSLALVASLVGQTANAQDDETDTETEELLQQCATAYEQAQVARNAGRLVAAQEHLRICVQEGCPEFVRNDCGQWLSDTKREVPSVIFSVVDSTGKDLPEVTIRVDGEEIASALDGRAIEFDPGQHEVVYEYQGKQYKETVVIRQGEKNRVLRYEIQLDKDTDGDGLLDSKDQCPTEAGAVADQGCPPPPPPFAQPKQNSELFTGALVGWGVGGAGLLTWGLFGILGNQADADARDECPTPRSCSNEREQELIDDVDNKFLIANIGLGVGIAGAATGTVLFFLSQPGKQDQDEQSVNVNVSPLTEGGGFVSVGSAF